MHFSKTHSTSRRRTPVTSRAVGHPSHLSLRVAVASALLVAHTVTSSAAVIDEPERQTIAEWARANELLVEDVDARYAATGVVTCNWYDAQNEPHASISTGQVTVERDLVTLSGHVFLDPFRCVRKARSGDCNFAVTIGGIVETVSITDILEVGYDCGSPEFATIRSRLRNDWAIARLERPLDVVPYRVPVAPLNDIGAGLNVVSVVHSQDYLLIGADGAELHPKTVGRCRVRDVTREGGDVVYFASDCDGAQRSSGGSVLLGEERPTLIGVWAASSEDRGALNAAVRRIIEAGGYQHELANVQAYAVNGWSSRHVPLNSAFLDAIREATAPVFNPWVTSNAGRPD